MNRQLVSDLNQVVASALNPNRTFVVQLEPDFLPLRHSLLGYLYQLCLKNIESDNEDAEEIIDAIRMLTDDRGYYAFEVIWEEQSEEVTTSYHRTAKLVVMIYENAEADEFYEYEVEQGSVTYQLHLKHTGYPESGVITGNIVSELQ